MPKGTSLVGIKLGWGPRRSGSTAVTFSHSAPQPTSQENTAQAEMQRMKQGKEGKTDWSQIKHKAGAVECPGSSHSDTAFTLTSWGQRHSGMGVGQSASRPSRGGEGAHREKGK